MQRYFIKELDIDNLKCVIDTKDVHHIKTVMRSKIGDNIIVCDSFENCFQATITELSNEVICKLEEKLPSRELPVKVDIAQALIRRERFEYMIQKSTELGVDTIIPIYTKNVIIKLDDKKQDKKVDRWSILAKEASEQSHRSKITTIKDITNLFEISFNHYDKVLVAYENEHQSNNLFKVLQTKPQNLCVVIGPEGGFTKKEIDKLSSIPNIEFVGLGNRILRSETASSYILSVISYVYEMSE